MQLSSSAQVDLSESSPEAKFQQALNASPLTRPMWMLWLLSAGLIALDGFDFFIIGVAMPFIQQDFGLGPAWVGAIATAALVGALLGSLILGPITDKVGRQRMLVVDIALFLLASVGTAIAWNAVSLLCFRLAVGVGIGADYPISVAYITENIPERHRGRMVISAFSFQALGALSGALVGWGTIWAFQQFAPTLAIAYAWRWMLGVGILLSLVVGGLRLLFLLESPSYYLAKERYEEASQAASVLLERPILLEPVVLIENLTAQALENESVPESSMLGSPLKEGTSSEKQSSPRLGYGDLFSPGYRKRTALAAVPWFLQDVATYGVGIFTPTIIAALTFAEGDRFLDRELAASQGAAIVNVFLVVGFLGAVLLINRFGRIPLQITGFVGMACGLWILSFANTGANINGNTDLPLLFVGFIIFNVTMNLGPNSTTFLLSGEVFPPEIRASGAGLAGAIAKSGAVLGALMLPIVQETYGVEWVVRSLAVVCAIAAIITYALRSAAVSSRETMLEKQR
jgi:MFS family permease